MVVGAASGNGERQREAMAVERMKDMDAPRASDVPQPRPRIVACSRLPTCQDTLDMGPEVSLFDDTCGAQANRGEMRSSRNLYEVSEVRAPCPSLVTNARMPGSFSWKLTFHLTRSHHAVERPDQRQPHRPRHGRACPWVQQ